MTSSFGYRTGPARMPDIIKKLLFVTGITGLGIALFQPLFNHISPISFQGLFSLSLSGLTKGFFWQPITYLFIPSTEGLSFDFLLNLLFTLCMLWMIGSQIVERLGKKSFLTLLAFTGIGSALITMTCAYFFSLPGLLTGLSAVLLGLLIMWAFIDPNQTILLFMIIPVKVKWIAAGLVSFCLLQEFSHMQWLQLILHSSALLITYCYAVMKHDLISPFRFTHALDKGLANITTFFDKYRKKTTPTTVRSKIYDFQSQEPIVDEEAFLNAMLDKISAHGKASLTFREKWRLKKISKKKRQS